MNQWDKDSLIKKFEERQNIKRHNLKKGDFLTNINKNVIPLHLKVIGVDTYSALVKYLDYKGLPFTLTNDKIINFRVLSKEEVKALKKERWARLIKCTSFEKISDFFFFVQRKTNLMHSQQPSGLKEYLGNWIAFFITFNSRMASNYWFSKNGEKVTGWFNTLKNSAPHGPLWPGHDYKEKN